MRHREVNGVDQDHITNLRRIIPILLKHVHFLCPYGVQSYHLFMSRFTEECMPLVENCFYVFPPWEK